NNFRRTLTGLVLFRIETLHTFREFVGEELNLSSLNWIPFILHAAKWELLIKTIVRERYATGVPWKLYNVVATPSTKEEFPWWDESYDGSQDRIDYLEEEYILAD
ncbi:hypothetical protein PFISCL1PPCAC_8658, partial [Pristionchus fissidentatus]